MCKSGRIDGLDESNVMPYWWHTSHWCKQYPQGVSVGLNFSIDTMRAGEQDQKYKLCPAISGPNKAGRLKLDKRHTSLIEQAMEKKKGKNQAKEAKKQASSTVTERERQILRLVLPGRSRLLQMVLRGYRSTRGRRSMLGSHILRNIVIGWLVISVCVYNNRAALGFT